MKNLILKLMLLLVMLVSMNIEMHAGGKDWLDGKWTGTGYQVDGQTWDIELTFYRKKGVMKISYPSLSCSGKWNLDKINSHRADFTETIQEGVENCDQGGEVVVTFVDANHVSLTYFLRSYSDKAIANAVMYRQ